MLAADGRSFDHGWDPNVQVVWLERWIKVYNVQVQCTPLAELRVRGSSLARLSATPQCDRGVEVPSLGSRKRMPCCMGFSMLCLL